MTPAEVRKQLVESLNLDLVGPEKGSELEEEVLPQAPSKWYLTGFLAPLEADETQRSEETSGEEVDEHNDAGGTDDAETPDPSSAKRVYFPSSMGMSLLLPAEARHAKVTVLWGDYRQEKRTSGDKTEDSGNGKKRKRLELSDLYLEANTEGG